MNVAKKRKAFERNGISPKSCTKQRYKTNHIKTKIDKTQQNNKSRLRGNKDETINHIISECSKLTQKEYKNRHDCMGKVIKKFEFNGISTTKHMFWIMTHKLLWDFDIQSYHLISARRSDLIIINNNKKITCRIEHFAVAVDQ